MYSTTFSFYIYRKTKYEILLCKIVFNLFKSNLFDINRYNTPVHRRQMFHLLLISIFIPQDGLNSILTIQCIHILQLHYLKAFRIFRGETNFGGMLIVTFPVSLYYEYVSDTCGCTDFIIHRCASGNLMLNRSKNDCHQHSNK